MSLGSTTDDELLAIVENLRLNEREPLLCNKCGSEVNEGERIVVRVHYDAADADWLVTGRFCEECAPSTIQGPKPFLAEAIVEGSIGLSTVPLSGERYSILRDPELIIRA